MGVLSLIIGGLQLVSGALPTLIKDGFGLWNDFHSSSGTSENDVAAKAQKLATDAVSATQDVVGSVNHVAFALQNEYPTMHPAHAQALAGLAVHVATQKASPSTTAHP